MNFTMMLSKSIRPAKKSGIRKGKNFQDVICEQPLSISAIDKQFWITVELSYISNKAGIIKGHENL